MFSKVHDHCTSASADAGICAQALSLGAQKAGGVPRVIQDGVCLIPYVIASLFQASADYLSLHKGSQVLLRTIHWYISSPALQWKHEAYNDRQNWSLTKKNVLFGTVCLVSMAGVASVTVHQLAYVATCQSLFNIMTYN